MPITSGRERLVNNVYRYYKSGTYLSWQGVDVESKTQGKHCFISPANSFNLHYPGLSYEDATAIQENKSLSANINIDLFI